MTTVGNIDNTQGAAIGPQAQAQNVAVNLQTRDLTMEVLDRLNTMSLSIERIDAKLDHVTDRTATALVGVEGRIYQLSKTAERQQQRNEHDRHEGQAEHTEQHEAINRQLAEQQELIRSLAAQYRLDRFVIGGAVLVLFIVEIGTKAGWW